MIRGSLRAVKARVERLARAVEPEEMPDANDSEAWFMWTIRTYGLVRLLDPSWVAKKTERA